jgi:hypothetical protein
MDFPSRSSACCIYAYAYLQHSLRKEGRYKSSNDAEYRKLLQIEDVEC